MKLRLIVATIGILAALALPMTFMLNKASAVTIDDTPDCDKYSVMWCGGSKMSSIVDKYEHGDGHNTAKNIQGIFSDLGISSSEVKASGFVSGVVYENGEIKVGSKVVAKNAKTYIRTMGKVSTSKMASAQTAFVKLNSDGQFLYAIMKPCGNPVSADNVVPKPKPQSLTCDALNVTGPANNSVSATIKATAKNGATITGYSIDFGDGTTTKSQSANHTYKKDGTYTIVGKVSGKLNGKNVVVTDGCKKQITIKTPPKPTPAYTCDALTTKLVGGHKVSATVTYTASGGATFKEASFNFGDGSKNIVSTKTTVQYEYAKAGTYIVQVTPSFIVNGKVVTATSKNCTSKVTISESPIYTCDALTLKTIGDRKISATVAYTALNGATLNNISYDFGDNSSALVTKETTAEHSYTADGTYTVRATPTFSVNGKTVTAPENEACAQNITFEKGEVVTPETPTSTPSTGPAETIGLFIGASTLSALGYRIWLIRRFGN